MAPSGRWSRARPYPPIASGISPRLADAALAAFVDDKMVDLTFPLTADARVRIVTNKSPEALELYRHSTAHLLAAAVTALFPGTQCGIGPPIDDGFFYDFVVERPFVPEDLAAIEAKMKELAGSDYIFERQRWPREEAIDFFKKRGEPLKVQLIEEKTAGQSEVSVYTIKDQDTFVDFCVGPHVPRTGKLKAFKLTTTSNAYWKGDAKNQPMQRVYGTAFFSQKELDEHVTRLEEAKKRDHRRVGQGAGALHVPSVRAGRGLLAGQGHDALQHARRLHARTALPRRLRRGEDADRLQQGAVGAVRALVALPREHVPGEVRQRHEMGLKAMNCPGHYLLYSSEKHSYKEMPIRFHDQTPLHRNEASGVLGGLTRVRQFSQDDAHCFVHGVADCQRGRSLLRLIQGVYGDFGLSYTAKLSTRPEKFIGEIATWDHAESSLKQALESAGQAYTINAGDGAFYGPKIDFDITDAIGRKWQCATIQLDYNAPERFDLTYVGADNAEHRPVVIHRAIFGSFERFIAILIEHFAGAFPLWLAPVQATVLPIADRHLDYARQVQARLAAAGMRVVVDDRQEKVNLKIRDAQLQKVPYMLVVGDREASDGAVSVRSRSKGDLGARPLDQFLTDALAEIGLKRYPRSLCR